jgi:hypothetical protein
MISIVLPSEGRERQTVAVARQYAQALSALDVRCELLVTSPRPGAVEVDTPVDRVTVRGVSSSYGWGREIRAGLAAAQGDLLGWTLPERTEPQTLANVVKYALESPRAVIRTNRRSRDTLPRRIGSMLYNGECRSLYNLTTWDVNGTPKVFPRALDKLLRLTRDDELIDLEFTVICRQEGYPVIEMPARECASDGAGSISPTTAVRMYWGAWKHRHTLQARPER